MLVRDDCVFLGPNLRRLRREKGLSRAGLARKMGISWGQLFLLERGRIPERMSVEALLQAGRALDTPPVRFFEPGGK